MSGGLAWAPDFLVAAHFILFGRVVFVVGSRVFTVGAVVDLLLFEASHGAVSVAIAEESWFFFGCCCGGCCGGCRCDGFGAFVGLYVADKRGDL